MTFSVLQDKVVIVTGAAMGMGAAKAKLFGAAWPTCLLLMLMRRSALRSSPKSSQPRDKPPFIVSTYRIRHSSVNSYQQQSPRTGPWTQP